MGLIKKRPAIKLFTPARVQTGQPFQVRLVLDCPAELDIDELVLELVGLGVFFTDSQYGRHRNQDVFCRAEVKPSGKQVLGEGRHEFEATFDIPVRFPPTYVGKHVRVEWELRIRVDIPWWPDAKASFTLPVDSGQVVTPAPAGNIWSSRPAGALPGKPHIELSVGTTFIEPGGTLDGAVALANVSANEYRGIDAKLVAVESHGHGIFENSQHVERARWRLDLDTPQENEPYRFSLRVPTDIVPEFETQRIGMKWFLRVDADVAWKIDPHVWVPLKVVPPLTELPALGPAPLAIGSDRIALIWRDVAEVTGFEHAGGALRRSFGLTSVEVRREHRGKKGAMVVAQIEYPDVGVGAGWEGFGRRFSCRDAGQAFFLNEKLAEALKARPPVAVDDVRMAFELEDAGQAVEPLRGLVEYAAGIAERFESLRDEIPAPAGLEEQGPAWQRAAQGVGGRFVRSAMRISGTRQELHFVIAAAFKASGAVDHLAVRVQPSQRVDARHHLVWNAGDSSEAPELVELTEGCERLEVGERHIELWIEADADGIEDAVSALERALAHAKRLTGQIGPYR